MKRSQIEVNGKYIAKVSNRLVTVRVDSIREGHQVVSGKSVSYYDVTNLSTGRRITFKTAAKFRSKANLGSSAKPVYTPGPRSISDLFRF